MSNPNIDRDCRPQRYRVCRVPGRRWLVVPPAAVHGLWAHRMLRQLARATRARHVDATGHTVITSFEPGEDWFYDFATTSSSSAGNWHHRKVVPRISPCPDPPAPCPMTGRTSCIPDLVDRYAVPARTASAELVVKKSRFLCTITRVDGREEARGVVDRLRKQHHEARHHCSAFVIGPDGTLEHSSDDGEPAGTAGAPMLEALRGSGLSDVVAVVTRWFGGVLLGPGGLVGRTAMLCGQGWLRRVPWNGYCSRST